MVINIVSRTVGELDVLVRNAEDMPSDEANRSPSARVEVDLKRYKLNQCITQIADVTCGSKTVTPEKNDRMRAQLKRRYTRMKAAFWPDRYATGDVDNADSLRMTSLILASKRRSRRAWRVYPFWSLRLSRR